MPEARRFTRFALFTLVLAATACSSGPGSSTDPDDPSADTDRDDVASDTAVDQPRDSDAGADGADASDLDLEIAPDPDVASDATLDVAPDNAPDTTVLDLRDDPDLIDEASNNECDFPAPAGGSRYTDLLGLEDGALIAGLHDLIDDHNGLTYNQARDIMYVTADIDVDDDGNIEGIYTGWTAPEDGTRSPDGPSGEITTEHTWPRSDGAEAFPAEGDLHHLAPAISEANGARGSFEFGDVACGAGGEPSCDWSEGGSQQGPSEVDGTDVFEVRPATRGNVARAHFYFSVRYELSIGANEEATLRRWHCEDPPDAPERARNAAIETHQSNRNPFVDRPGLVFRIADF